MGFPLGLFGAHKRRTLVFAAPGNCLREVRCAVNERMPLVLVHEADPTKGGLPLSAIKLECPSELREGIFLTSRRQKRAVITWMRVRAIG